MSKNLPNVTARRWKLRKGKHRVCGMSLLAIGLVVMTLWVSSAWFAWRIGGDNYSWWAHMTHGVFQVVAGPEPAGWTFYSPYGPAPLVSALGPEWSWLAKFPTPSEAKFNIGIVAGFMPIDSAGQTRWVNISGWALALPPLLIGLWLLLERRWPTGRCQRCGYDRSGIAPMATCPECGQIAARQSAAAVAGSAGHTK